MYMTKEGLKVCIENDLRDLGLPIEEFDIEFYPKFCKSFYGKYFPIRYLKTLKNNKRVKPYIKIYPMTASGDLMNYEKILETAIHESIHHLQHTNLKWKRKRGVMHDLDFYKLFNYYKMKRRELIEIDRLNKKAI